MATRKIKKTKVGNIFRKSLKDRERKGEEKHKKEKR
jgi:hypothetical protein